MKALRNYLDKIKPNFEEGGKFHAFRSVFDGFETFLFVPNATSKSGTHIHDSIDSKRIMSMVVIALVPALLFGMYNVGYQHFHATGATGGFWEMFIYGFLAVLPKIIVSYVVGLGIEFVVAQWKKEEIQEGFLVSGILIPMIVPVDCPLWILAVATAFSVIFAKEVFGGTGMNVFNVALITRAFLFFAYPTKMSGAPHLPPLDQHDYCGSCPAEQLEVIRQVHRFLTEHLDSRITIEQLSRQFLMNPSTMKELFKEVYGSSIAAHIRQHRMERASALLLESDDSVAQIARAVGYESQSKFTSEFKKAFSMLPTEYRRLHKQA